MRAVELLLSSTQRGGGGEAPIGPADYARPEVLIGFAASLVRYPAAFALKAPARVAACAGFVGAWASWRSMRVFFSINQPWALAHGAAAPLVSGWH